MSDIGGLQLLPSQPKKISFGLIVKNKSMLTAIVLFICLIISYVVGLLIQNSIAKDISEIDANIAVIHQARNKEEEEKLKNFKAQLVTMGALMKDHIAWSGGFANLQKLILPQITFSGLKADSKKRTVSFVATADSYTTVAKQVASFYGTDMISDVRFSRVGMSQRGGIDFDMEVTFKPDVFLFYHP